MEEYERVTENNIEIIPHTNKRYYKYKNKTTNENEEIYVAGVSNVEWFNKREWFLSFNKPR